MMTFDLFIQTSYSFNGSLLDVDKLITRAKEAGYTALGITDTNNLYAAIKFYQKCKSAGIKPIIGTLIDVLTPKGIISPFLLYAKNNIGYNNLLKIVSESNTQGNTLSWDFLMANKSQIIAVSPTDRGDIHQAILSNDLGLAADLHRQYASDFEDFYLGIDLTDFTSEMRIAPMLQSLGECIIIHQVHYLDKEDVRASKVLRAILKDEKITSEGLFRTEEAFYDFKTPEQLSKLYSDYKLSIKTTEKMISEIDFSISFNDRWIPRYPLAEGVQAIEYLTALTAKGLERRLASKKDGKSLYKTYHDRIGYELSVIQKMGFCDYFLVVWDFVLYAKKHGILVGPGRGSAAGSLVSYVLGIVDVDPIEHHLVFERFLNPERITMPDIDMDFPDNRRDEVIRYVVDKYGKDHVANIIAFGTFQGKSAIRDTARIFGINDVLVNEITGYISETDNSIEEFKKQNPSKYEFLMSTPETADLLSISERISGLPRHISTHAAGIVITDHPITDHAPVQNGLMGMYQTQFEAVDLEQIGLLKIDFLGITNLTIIDRILKMIESATSEKINIYRIPLDDPKTFKLLRDVNTLGVFQLESDGMKNLIRNMQFTSFDDIAVCIALYRPGPMENIPTYLRRRNRTEQITYPHPDLEKILKETYGIIVYQEQILQIAHDFAGYSLGEADVLRRAVSKKKEDVLQKEREQFVRKCQEKQYTEKVANEVYDYIVKFANYGFNKSHSVVYAVVAYWMAYLKANYSPYFLAALLDASIGSAATTTEYIKECHKLGIRILPPRINESGKYYVNEDGNLRYPYLGIRNIGGVAADKMEEIKKDGPFTSFVNFMERAKDLTSRMIESMIMVGMFDSFGQTKKTLISNLKQITSYVALGDYARKDAFVFREEPEYDFDYLLEQEKALLGLNLSYHPITRYHDFIQKNQWITVSELPKNSSRPVEFVGMLGRMKNIKTKKGDEMAFLDIEDEFESIDCILFSNEYLRYGGTVEKNNVYLIQGNLDFRNGKWQVVISTLSLLK